ncbi:MAG: SIMPL domain-containing protein [Verrucomicrobiales bacterium]|nr:SIMPL domain-containing protein [Verrucomicrobiales bacterium]
MAAMSDKTGYGVAGILALGLIIATMIGGRALEKMRSVDDGITVKGVAEKRITSDLASWRGQITLKDKNLSTGYDELQAQFKTTIEFLKSKGIPAESIEEGTIGTSTTYKRDERGHATSEVDAFTLTQSFTVETLDVNLAKRLAKESTELLRQGIDFRSFAPSYFFTKLEDLKLDLLEEAAANSKLRAERLAKSAGNRVVGVISASQGIFQITKPNSTQTSSWGMYDTSSIEKKVRAVVTMEFRTE